MESLGPRDHPVFFQLFCLIEVFVHPLKYLFANLENLSGQTQSEVPSHQFSREGRLRIPKFFPAFIQKRVGRPIAG